MSMSAPQRCVLRGVTKIARRRRVLEGQDTSLRSIVTSSSLHNKRDEENEKGKDRYRLEGLNGSLGEALVYPRDMIEEDHTFMGRNDAIMARRSLMQGRRHLAFSNGIFSPMDVGADYMSWTQMQTCRTMVSRTTTTPLASSPSATTTTHEEKDESSNQSSTPSTTTDNKPNSNKVLSQEQRQSMERNANKFKLLMRQYGPVFAGTYLTAYVATLGSLFVAVHWGFLEPSTIDFSGTTTTAGTETVSAGDVATANPSVSTDTTAGGATEASPQNRPSKGGYHEMLVHWMEKYNWTRPYAERVAAHPALLHLGVAWVATKFTEPLRLGFTVFATPRIARFLGKAPQIKKEGEEDGEEAEKKNGESGLK